MRTFLHWIVGGALCAMAVSSPLAAQSDEPEFGRLVESFKKPYFSVGVLIQTVADFQIERSEPGGNGFTLANARLNVGGELDGGFGYFLQANFAGSPTILDARLSYRPTRAVRLSVGQFKAPFSYEFLTSAASIDFVNRAQVVTTFAPNRQLGAEVAVGAASGPIGISAGVFNGNAFRANGNDGNDLMYVMRVSGTPVRSRPDRNTQLRFGVNAAFSQDAAAAIPGLVTAFTGDRTLLGADARFTSGPVLLSGEVLYGRLDPPIGTTLEPWGFHATAGYKFTPKTQGLVRWDRLDLDFLGSRDLVIFGFNVWPTQATEMQVNYLFDTDQASFDNHQLLVNFQVGF